MAAMEWKSSLAVSIIANLLVTVLVLHLVGVFQNQPLHEEAIVKIAKRELRRQSGMQADEVTCDCDCKPANRRVLLTVLRASNMTAYGYRRNAGQLKCTCKCPRIGYQPPANDNQSTRFPSSYQRTTTSTPGLSGGSGRDRPPTAPTESEAARVNSNRSSSLFGDPVSLAISMPAELTTLTIDFQNGTTRVLKIDSSGGIQSRNTPGQFSSLIEFSNPTVTFLMIQSQLNKTAGRRRFDEELRPELVNFIDYLIRDSSTRDITVVERSGVFTTTFWIDSDGTFLASGVGGVGRSYREFKFEGGTVFVRWGSESCVQSSEPAFIADVSSATVFTKGSASELLCLSQHPQTERSNSSFTGQELSTQKVLIRNPSEKNSYTELPCTICHEDGKTTSRTFVGKTSCPNEWFQQYSGIVMGGDSRSTLSGHYCVDLSRIRQFSAERRMSYTSMLEFVAPGNSVNERLSCIVCSR